jgi:protein pelota
MQITRKNWKASLAEGTVNITPEDTDDIWAIYNLICPGDEVECVTMRKVLQESNSGEVVDSQKMKMVLAVKAEKIDIDLAAASLRVNGRNVKESKHVKLGSYHTLDIEPDRWLKLTKSRWDALSVEVLEQALSSVGRTEIGAIVMQEGLAHVCTVTPTNTRVLQRVEVAMPKKKLGATSQLEKATEKFLTQCVDAMVACIRFDALKAIVVAGTESLKEEVYKRLIDRAQKDSIKAILENKSKFLRLVVSSGQPAALTDVLKEPRIVTILADTKAAKEAKILDSYHKMHNNDADRTTFGRKHVLSAAEQCAVHHLMLSDSLFRSLDAKERKLYADIVGTVKENGGQVTIFSTGSEPEVELSKLSGIAAILNFSIEE